MSNDEQEELELEEVKFNDWKKNAQSWTKEKVLEFNDSLKAGQMRKFKKVGIENDKQIQNLIKAGVSASDVEKVKEGEALGDKNLENKIKGILRIKPKKRVF